MLSPRPGDKLKSLHESGELAEWLPALAALDINDKHSHRHKNNFLHSIAVLEQAILLETKPDLILRTAALFHDIGKVETRKVPKRGPVTFRSHEVVGAREIKKILKEHKYSRGEIYLVSELIANHMRSYNFDDKLWTDSAIRRLIKDLGTPVQLERLYKIFKADVTTKYDSKRAKIYAKVDILEKRAADIRKKDELAARRPAINGEDVMAMFGLKPGPEVGLAMAYLKTEEGLNLTREQAIEKMSKIVGRTARL